MAYFNRKEQLKFTLRTIQESKYPNKEIIIVDDASSDNHRLEEVIKNYKLDIKLIRIEPQDKKYINPCVPNNIGFKQVTGEIIIIQNPECCHIGDIITFIGKNIGKGEYFSMTCIALTKPWLNPELYKIYNEKGCEGISKFVTQRISRLRWYNHPRHRPVDLNFMTAINKEDLDKLGGFDERYAYGSGKDDYEFIYRIWKMGLKVRRFDEHSPYVIHQWHPKFSFKSKKKIEINQEVFKKHRKEIDDYYQDYHNPIWTPPSKQKIILKKKKLTSKKKLGNKKSQVHRIRKLELLPIASTKIESSKLNNKKDNLEKIGPKLAPISDLLTLKPVKRSITLKPVMQLVQIKTPTKHPVKNLIKPPVIRRVKRKKKK